MKTNWRINQIYYNLLILMLLSSTTFFIPNSSALATAGGPPTIVISNPNPDTNVFLNNSQISLSGTYSDDNVQQLSDLLFTAYDQISPSTTPVKISDSVTNPGDWNLTNNGAGNPSGSWTFKNTLAEGKHTITIKVEEKVSLLLSSQQNITFTIDITRPYITGTGAVLSDNTVRSGEDLTSVPQYAKIKISVADNNQMSQLINNIQNAENPYNPVIVKLGTNQISGTASIVDTSQSGNYSYDIIFTPSAPLTINQTYIAYLDPSLTDDSNNKVFAKFFKLTTKTNTSWDDPDDQSHTSSNPHGHYQLNTDMCASCHSTHVNSPYDLLNNSSSNPKQEGGSYIIDFNEQLSANPSENYCMACHDGTTNAPIISGMNSKYHHDNPIEYSQTGANNLKDATSCTSCHNPHLEWSPQNPNLLLNHYVYTHNSADVGQSGLTAAVVDSTDTSCKTCHDDYLIHNTSTNTVTSIFDQKYNPNSTDNQVYSYSKSMTAVGSITPKVTDSTKNTILDYSLCLRCHQASADQTLSNIEQYYVQTNSGHYFALPGGKTTQGDGSPLNGPIPCAECHETHGSNNIDMLRTQLGNDPNASAFATSGTTWTPANERTFCLKCHDNKTAIYGKIGIFNTTKSDGTTPITGHQPTDTQACSECHGGAGKSVIEAAHAPKMP